MFLQSCLAVVVERLACGRSLVASAGEAGKVGHERVLDVGGLGDGQEQLDACAGDFGGGRGALELLQAGAHVRGVGAFDQGQGHANGHDRRGSCTSNAACQTPNIFLDSFSASISQYDLLCGS